MTKLSMEPSLIEPVDVLGDGVVNVVYSLPRPVVANQLDLGQTALRLRHGIDVRITQ